MEKAAKIRDKMIIPSLIQERQYIDLEYGTLYMLATKICDNMAIVWVYFIPGGRLLGGKSYFPRTYKGTNHKELLLAFIPQYYLGKSVTNEILLGHTLKNIGLLEEVLQKKSKHSVKLRKPQRGTSVHRMQLATANATTSLSQHLSSHTDTLQGFKLLQIALGMEKLLQRIEYFDISHTQGEKAIASYVISSLKGSIKSDYRKFNIKDITPSDDYAAMHQVLTRHLTHCRKDTVKHPDLLLIDGGKDQLTEA